MVINPRHIAFIDEYLSNGLDSQKAYVAIYQATNPSTIASAASRLLNNVDIRAEIAKRQTLAYANASITRDQLIADAIRIKDENITDNPSVALKAIEIMAKMMGLNEPQKVEHSGSQPITIIRTVEITSAPRRDIYGSTTPRIDAADAEDVNGADA